MLEVVLIIRIFQFIPLILVLVPLIKSFWLKRNNLNGLRPTRISLIILFSSLVFSNFYFICFHCFDINRSQPENQFVVLLDKIISLVAYLMLYLLFKHASTHEKK